MDKSKMVPLTRSKTNLLRLLEGKKYDTFNIEINNPWFQERLDGIIKTCKKLDPATLELDNRDPTIDKHYGTSDEYLHKLLKQKERRGPRGEHYPGWPQAIKGCDIGAHPRKFLEWSRFKKDITYTFCRELGAQQNALLCYYPEDGFIGWHNNSNTPGYSILFTWSETGDGCYKMKSKRSGEIITLNDKPGWICRHGYYGEKESNQQWHSALTNEPRWSIAFYLRNAEMTKMFIEEIESTDG